MSPPSYSKQLIEPIIAWLWRSWISCGVSGHGDPGRADLVIDPEALLLASSVWARYDARLFDEILDWLCLHGALINLQRLRNLHQTGLGNSAILSSIARVVQQNSDQTKWKAIIQQPAAKTELEPLFHTFGDSSEPWGIPEPLFAEQGFHRGKFELRRMSQSPNPNLAPNLCFKLRCLFGTSTRAEIMLHLLTKGSGTAAEIARISNFTPRAILVPLRELANSGHLYEPPRPIHIRTPREKQALPRTRGLSIAYGVRVEDWRFLKTWNDPAGFPELKSPAGLLLLCQQYLESLPPESDNADRSLRAIRLRARLTPTFESIQRHGLSGDYGLPTNVTGEDLVNALAEQLPIAIQQL